MKISGTSDFNFTTPDITKRHMTHTLASEIGLGRHHITVW